MMLLMFLNMQNDFPLVATAMRVKSWKNGRIAGGWKDRKKVETGEKRWIKGRKRVENVNFFIKLDCLVWIGSVKAKRTRRPDFIPVQVLRSRFFNRDSQAKITLPVFCPQSTRSRTWSGANFYTQRTKNYENRPDHRSFPFTSLSFWIHTVSLSSSFFQTNCALSLSQPWTAYA